MAHFSYKGGCGIHERTHIEAMKRTAGLAMAIDKNVFSLLVIKCYLKQLYH